MKIKCRPEDFIVEELADVRAEGGDFALYRLVKQSFGTFEAVEAVARAWRIPRGVISYGGLKDRHAATRQFLTVPNGPRRNLVQDGLQVEYLGQTDRPFTPDHIRGNRFAIVLRDLDARELETALAALDAVRHHGLANYFDDQRFGSLGGSRQFIAQPWCGGDFERALWLAIAEPRDEDHPRDREQKRLLHEHWGDWAFCFRKLSKSERRHCVAVLAQNPRDFRRAFAQIRPDLRGMYLAAYQSFFWNELLAEWLRRTVDASRLVDVELATGRVPFVSSLNDDEQKRIAGEALPLPSARLHLEPGPLKSLMDEVLARHGTELRLLRVKYPRDSFFAKGERAAVVHPANLDWGQGHDELYAGRNKLTLRFDLPRGSYATILIKRLTKV